MNRRRRARLPNFAVERTGRSRCSHPTAPCRRSSAPMRRQLVITEGAHHVLDHAKADYRAEIMAITGGRGVDLVMEMLANVNLDRDLGVLALRGRIVVIGNRGTVEINARQAMVRDAAILGMVLWNTPEDEMAGIQAALGAGQRDAAPRGGPGDPAQGRRPRPRGRDVLGRPRQDRARALRATGALAGEARRASSSG